MKKLDHFDSTAFLAVHNAGAQLVSVRLNEEKISFQNNQWPENITEPPFKISGTVPWASHAYYLSVRPSFTLDPLFHAGAYYVQEASGMFLEFALKRTVDLSKKLNVLDLCAAPGGKSTLIQSLISKDSLLVSNEVIKNRIPALSQNMTKWGRSNGIISNNDPAHFKQLPGFFDVMLVDAPCSGSGLFRKDPDVANTWSPDLVKLCSQRQQRIVADVWDCLKEDGILIYSTCSYSKEENEDILDSIFNQFSCISLPLAPDLSWRITETMADQSGARGYRFYPDKLSGEGFFLAVIQKKERQLPGRSSIINGRPGRPGRLAKVVEQQLQQWIKTESIHFISVGDSIHAIPAAWLNELEILKNSLYLKKAGIRMGKSGENDWIPDHELALGTILNEKVGTLELSLKDALHYLRAESFHVDPGGRGWRVICYRGQRIGWVKLLDKRMNNYYPKSSRIRF